MQARSILVAAAIVALSGGCAASPEDSEEATFGWLQPGKSTKQDVVLRLGIPRDVYDRERVFVYGLAACYRLWWVPTVDELDIRDFYPCDRYGGVYDLVVAFDANGTVRNRSVVKPRTLASGR